MEYMKMISYYFSWGWIYDFSGMKEVAESLSKSENSDVKLMIVDEGDLYELLLRMRSERNITSKLILVGKVPFDQINQYVAAADICLLPAIKNNVMMNIVPIKMYGYMAMGRPVITTNLPGIRKEFGTKNGVVYVESPRGVLEKSLWLYNANRIKSDGIRAYSYVKDLTWDNVTDEFEYQLEELICRS